MTKLLMLAAATALILSGSASAQELKQMTNCSERTGTGRAGQNAQAVEKSAILPSAGGGQSSAAPTVQRDGKSVEVRSDCPEENKK